MHNPQVNDIYKSSRGKTYRVIRDKDLDFLVLCKETGASRFISRKELKYSDKFTYVGQTDTDFSSIFEVNNAA